MGPTTKPFQSNLTGYVLNPYEKEADFGHAQMAALPLQE